MDHPSSKSSVEASIESWQDAIESALKSSGVELVQKVLVLRETASTQEAASRAAGSTPTLVVADRQTAGRGRLGRPWIQGSSESDSGLGIAATFALPGCQVPPPRLSLAAGLAAHEACARSLGSRDVLGLRWPNDVVERGGAQRKVAGVLVEAVGPLILVGIGINVLHEQDDFPGSLAERAVSLRQLGSRCSRLSVLLALIGELDRALRASPEEITTRWSALDTLVGSRRTLIQAGRRYQGTVRSIQPSSHIELETSEGVVQLPSLTTSLVHDEN
ncbi:MAG: biotin--[acetyl-CoA-carboxylase] ligase [Phycisphaerales bacterium]|nr:biotin--[acetyl-CoA-carboxylase] ligase [Planctomycetota bacterium]